MTPQTHLGGYYTCCREQRLALRRAELAHQGQQLGLFA